MTTEAEEIRVLDARDAGRYEAYVGDALAAHVTYRLRGSRITFVHTEVDPAFEGRGVGRRLATWALDDVCGRGLAVRPRCPFIAAFIRRHPEYADLVEGGAVGPA